MSNIYSRVGTKIRLYRKSKRLTQEELAGLLQIDPSYFGKIERGEVNITLETLAKISDALKVDPSQLIEEDRNLNVNKNTADILVKIETLLISLTNEELQRVHRILKEVTALRVTTQKRT